MKKKDNNNKVCLVLEGGALRGLYTAGVLDVLHENNINVDCIIGVSAGALFGVNYFSNQSGRVLRYNRKFCNDKRYISIRSLLLTGNLVNKKFAYYKVTKELDPFDEEEFEKTNKPFYCVATNVETGEPEYILLDKPLEQLEEIRATSAMPFVSRIIKIGNKKYLDGAIGDSIPIKKAQELGYSKIVVVLTQPENYTKEELDKKMIGKVFQKYKKYPKFVDAFIARPKMYNDTLKYIKKLEDKNEIFVFRPYKSIDIDPIKKTVEQLDDAYNMGKEEALNKLKDLKKFLK